MHVLTERSSGTEAQRQQQRLITALCESRRYPHPVAMVEHLETHISHVMLAGEFAYKIKKPVDLGFLDFRDLKSRRHYCEEELRLNRRTAPAIYLEVIPITGRVDKPVVGGAGPVIEYAVKMHRFPQSALFSTLLNHGELTARHVDILAVRIAEFHGDVTPAEAAGPFGELHTIKAPVLQNFTQLGPLLKNKSDQHMLKTLRAYTERAHAQLRDVFAQRKREGFVRECHGDLHLENIVWFGSDAVPFDCIEFNEHLRWIDVMNEVAFVVMDLCARGHPELGFRLLNTYLERTSDYGGLAVLRYYMIYRTLVRTKVLALRAQETNTTPCDEARRIRGYLELAHYFAVSRRTAIIITHGVSGSGKSTLAQHLLEALGAIRVRSDVERKRLAGLTSTARTGSAPERGIYAPQATLNTYAKLARLARLIVRAGYPAIVDAAFLRREQRRRLHGLATQLGIPFVILNCQAPEAVLRARVAERERHGQDPSEANLAVLEHQLETREPLTSDEQATAIVFDEGGDWYEMARMLKARLGHV